MTKSVLREIMDVAYVHIPPTMGVACGVFDELEKEVLMMIERYVTVNIKEYVRRSEERGGSSILVSDMRSRKKK